MKFDWTPSAAAAFVAQAEWELRLYLESPETRRRMVREAIRWMMGGLIMSLLALRLVVILVLTRLTGAPILAPVGLILVGLVFFSRGFAKWRAYRRVDALFKR